MRLGIWAGADALGTGITWCPQGRRVWDGNGFREPWIIFRKTISRMQEESFRGAESRGRYWALLLEDLDQVSRWRQEHPRSAVSQQEGLCTSYTLNRKPLLAVSPPNWRRPCGTYDGVMSESQVDQRRGFLQRTPEKRTKSVSAVCTCARHRFATAAIWASVVRLPPAPASPSQVSA